MVLMYGLEVAIKYAGEKCKLDTYHLWKARFAMMHNDTLSSNAERLCDECLDHFEKYISSYRLLRAEIEDEKLFSVWKKNLGMLLAEQSFALIQFWKYE